MDNIKVAIIGGGPVGIFASFACGMLGIQTHIFESRDMLGGQCNALYPEKMIYDIPGIPQTTAENLINQLHQQANAFKPVIHLSTQIKKITHQSENIIINDQSFHAAILATGFGECIPTKLALPEASKYENIQIFYQVTNTEQFKNKKIAILGGGNSAADWALHLSDICDQVHMIHRRDVFTAFPSSVEQLEHKAKAGQLHLHNGYTIKTLQEHSNLLTGIVLQSKNGDLSLDVDYIIACYGMRSDSSTLKMFDVKLEDNKILVDPATCQTNKQKIYAVGDIAFSKTKTKLFSILAGFHECTLAAHHIHQQYNPSMKLTHSSDMKIIT